jgi:hypothetical protein
VSSDRDDLRAVVHDTLRAVLGRSVADWPAARPLAELPDAVYDSLAQLEVLTRLERTLRIAPGPVDPRRLGSIDSLVRYAAAIPEGAAPGGAAPDDSGPDDPGPHDPGATRRDDGAPA